MLRIGDFGFVGTDSKKVGIKVVNIGQRCGYRNIVWIADRLQRDSGGQQFRFA